MDAVEEKVNSLKYNSYTAMVNYSYKDMVFHGKIEGIRDLATFESDSVNGLEQEFRKAVDDYLKFRGDKKD